MIRHIGCVVLCVALLCLSGCSQPQKSVEEQNMALVKFFGESCDARAYDRIWMVLDSGFVRHCQATPGVVVQNREQFIEYLKADAAVFPDSRQNLRQIVAEGDMVAFSLKYEGTHDGQMGLFPPSHKKMQLDVFGMFRVKEGKLAELWLTWDNMAALGQLGHLPPPAHN
jgi:predicted ester cyclase